MVTNFVPFVNIDIDFPSLIDGYHAVFSPVVMVNVLENRFLFIHPTDTEQHYICWFLNWSPSNH